LLDLVLNESIEADLFHLSKSWLATALTLFSFIQYSYFSEYFLICFV